MAAEYPPPDPSPFFSHQWSDLSVPNGGTRLCLSCCRFFHFSPDRRNDPVFSASGLCSGKIPYCPDFSAAFLPRASGLHPAASFHSAGQCAKVFHTPGGCGNHAAKEGQKYPSCGPQHCRTYIGGRTAPAVWTVLPDRPFQKFQDRRPRYRPFHCKSHCGYP